jgi:hypothetical protein
MRDFADQIIADEMHMLGTCDADAKAKLRADMSELTNLTDTKAKLLKHSQQKLGLNCADYIQTFVV